MTTLFPRASTRQPSQPSGALAVLRMLAGVLWLGLAIVNFHRGHNLVASLQASAGVLFFLPAAVNFSRWLKLRRVR